MHSLGSRLVPVVPFIFVLLWSTGFIGAKYALPYIEPFYLLFIRMVLTIGVFLLLCLWFRVTWPDRRQSLHQMVTGVLVHGCYLGGVFAAIKWDMPAGVTAIVVVLQPLLTALLGWQWLGERLRPVQWAGLLLGLLGVGMVLGSGIEQGEFNLSWPPLLAVIGALLAISVGTLYQKRYGGGVNLLAGSFWQYVSTAVLMAILAWSFETRDVVWDTQLIWALVWLVFGLSVTAILLLMYMIREGEAARVASYFYLVPPMATLEAWLLFDEQLSAIALVGVLIAVSGVYLVLKKPRLSLSSSNANQRSKDAGAT